MTPTCDRALSELVEFRLRQLKRHPLNLNNVEFTALITDFVLEDLRLLGYARVEDDCGEEKVWRSTGKFHLEWTITLSEAPIAN
jgi:hypothetical protein